MEEIIVTKYNVNYKIKGNIPEEDFISKLHIIKTAEEDAVTFQIFSTEGRNDFQINQEIYTEEIGKITYFSNSIDTFIDYELSHFTEILKKSSNIEIDDLTEISIQEDFTDFELKDYSFEEILKYSLFKDRIEDKVLAHSIELVEVNKEFSDLGFATLLIDLALQDIKNDFIDDIIVLNASPMNDNRKNISNLKKLYSKNGFDSFLDQSSNDNMKIENIEDIIIINKEIIEKALKPNFKNKTLNKN